MEYLWSNVSDIANKIVGSGSDSESSDDENDDYESLVSDLNNDGENETDNEQGGNEAPESTTVPSLLDVLRAPKLSEISRKRKIYSNTRGGKRGKARSSSSASESKNIQPQQRLKQYPNEPFSLLNSSFSSQQQSSLQDYIETSLILQYSYIVHDCNFTLPIRVYYIYIQEQCQV